MENVLFNEGVFGFGVWKRSFPKKSVLTKKNRLC